MQGTEAGLLALQDAGFDVDLELDRIRDALRSLPGPKAGWKGPGISAVGYAAFALVGSECFELLRKLSPVDLQAPEQVVPCGAQAPIHDVRCVIVRLEGTEGVPGLIILGERGYGGFLSDMVLDAGEEFGLSPAGWRRFELWLKE
ncbi:MAG: hypothetical protein R6X07_06855 [Desulfatiglandales bacterium]